MFRFLLLVALAALACSQSQPAPEGDNKKEIQMVPIITDMGAITGAQPMLTTTEAAVTETVPAINATTTTPKPTEPSVNVTTTDHPSSAITVGAFSAASLCVLSLLMVS